MSAGPPVNSGLESLLTAQRLGGGGDGSASSGTSGVGVFWFLPGFQVNAFSLTSGALRVNNMFVAAVTFGNPRGWGAKLLDAWMKAGDQLREINKGTPITSGGSLYTGSGLPATSGGGDGPQIG